MRVSPQFYSLPFFPPRSTHVAAHPTRSRKRCCTVAHARRGRGVRACSAKWSSCSGAREGMQLRDRVVGKYAALVRRFGGASRQCLHRRRGKVQVVAIADTFADENPALDTCVAGLLGELDVSNARLVAARTLTAELEDMHAKFAVKQTRVDDRSAAGMVQQTRNHDIAAPIARCAVRGTLDINVVELTQRLRRGEEQLQATRS
ncbi:hypothetical protein DFH07DRAFT_952363 [Mycena maculata]|uniref:Uncharacterized protein n=1 Tax=Mycena maculata TaxID=230809 RepID=A0AAD7NTH0_9AGAR|nr:hypothetical protein DFH07DRAFT_952363 [Mycena maculata]